LKAGILRILRAVSFPFGATSRRSCRERCDTAPQLAPFLRFAQKHAAVSRVDDEHRR